MILFALALTATASSHLVVDETLIDSAQLPSNATSSEIVLQVSADPTEEWEITAQVAENYWDGRLSLALKRMGDGTGNGTIVGGTTTYQPLDASAQVFFEGVGVRSDIPIHCRVEGIDLNIPPFSDYISQIQFILKQKETT